MLKNGTKLPLWGKNYSSYSYGLSLIGRTYVHSKVRDILIEAYRNLEKVTPGIQFKYGETGFKEGGEFKPHKTHQNGLSVDLMVPVVGLTSNIPEPLKTHVLNKWGYDIDFDKNGKNKIQKIDFDSLGKLIVEIHKVVKKQNVEIWRIIFAPRLQDELYKTTSCLLYTSPSPRDATLSRMPSSA